MVKQHEVAIEFLESDLEKEKLKQKAKVSYKSSPSISVKEVNDDERTQYASKYNNLLKVFNEEPKEEHSKVKIYHTTTK